MRTKLTDATVRSLKSDGKYWDEAFPGFGLRISGKAKSWIVMFGSERRSKTLGHYPALSLAGARRKAATFVVEPETAKVRFDDALRLFEDTHLDALRPSTRRENLRILKKHFLPPLKAKNVSELNFGRLQAILDGIHAPSEANHAFRVMRTFLNWAKRRQLIEHNPLAGLPQPNRERQRDRVLTRAEIGAHWNREGKFADLWKILLLTGQRRSQIGLLEWGWIGETITFPAAVMKSGRDHAIPIGDMARSIIERQPRESVYVFPSRHKSKPITGWAKLKEAHDNRVGVSDYTLHDLRRTLATNMAALGTPQLVVEKLLDHSTGIQTPLAQIYNRHNYMGEMREAVRNYENWLSSSVLAG